MRATLLAVALCAALASCAASDACLGQFQVCSAGDCVVSPADCGACGAGQYLCPDRQTCVDGAVAYDGCPGIKGTHLDWTLSVDQRLDYLVAHTNTSEQIAQLTNDAPGIPRLSVPAYNWLNDDEHGVKQHHATSFPNGNTLGATFSKQTLYRVGRAVGMEARGLYNGFTNDGNRGHGQNGLGITLYAPNLNLVRDPR